VLWQGEAVQLHRPAVGLAVLILALSAVLAGCGQVLSRTGPSTTPTAGPPASAGPSVSGSGSPVAGTTCEYTRSGLPAKTVNLPPTTGVLDTGTVKYVLAMTNGKVTITLDRAAAPCTVNSFVSLAEQGFYDGTRCHRLADSKIFVLQCGDPTGSGSGGPGYQFANETDGSESYVRGVVAMANSGGPASNGSQFFMVWDDSTLLDQIPNYTIFGRLDTTSRDVVASMAAEGQDGSNPDGTGRPNNPSEITTVSKG
jgi:peptidyl-prolyl cis-trans isomerase B (cyclophilin B)